MKASDTHWAGSSTFLFRIDSDGQLRSIPQPYEAATTIDDTGLRIKDPAAWDRGDYWADVAVTVDLWWSPEGRIFVGGIDVVSVPGGPGRNASAAQHHTLNNLGPDVTGELTATLWRQIPIGTLIDKTMAALRDSVDRYSDRVPAAVAAEWRRLADAVPTRPQPGPKPDITQSDLAELVAPAYLTGGRRPVVAVQEALRQAGHSGGIVTIDQARKAVQRARRAGLIPPAAKKGKP